MSDSKSQMVICTNACPVFVFMWNPFKTFCFINIMYTYYLNKNFWKIFVRFIHRFLHHSYTCIIPLQNKKLNVVTTVWFWHSSSLGQKSFKQQLFHILHKQFSYLFLVTPTLSRPIRFVQGSRPMAKIT